MKPKVYIETSIVSYLAARPSNDVRAAAHQNSTWDWWDNTASSFDIFISELVLLEAGRGNAQAAQRRIGIIQDLPILRTTSEITDLGDSLIAKGALPSQAKLDALHIACAALNGMHYLLTWNCKHIANAIMRPRIEAICSQAGYEPPIICTPEELQGELKEN